MDYTSRHSIRPVNTANILRCCAANIALVLLGVAPLSNFAAPATQPDKAEMLRSEIKMLEGRMAQTEAGQRSVVQKLQDLDQKIELRRRLIAELESQSERGSQRVSQLKRAIGDQEVQIAGLTKALGVEELRLQDLQAQVSRRMVVMYERLKPERVAFLFAATDLNDFARRQRYVQAITRFDQAQLAALRAQRDRVDRDRSAKETLRQSLASERDQQIGELQSLQRILSERRSEEASLQEERADKETLRKSIAADASLLRELLEERKQALAEIGRQIAQLEEQPRPKRQSWQADIPFRKLEGRLPWPLAKHRIIQRFGTITHPDLGTSIVNPGVDLASAPGDPVRAVAKGEVTKIAYLRGFGNTLILSHGDGYYTVYARLGQIMAGEGDTVNAGQVIADLGDSGAEGGLHFEIWEKREKLNPQDWFAR